MNIITSIGDFLLTILAYAFTIGIVFGGVWFVCDSIVNCLSCRNDSKKSLKITLLVFALLVALFTYWHFAL